MQYEKGLIELSNEEISHLAFIFMHKIERYYDANDFISQMLDVQVDLEKTLQNIAALSDRTSRKDLESDIYRLTRDVAKLYEERAREAIDGAGSGINVH